MSVTSYHVRPVRNYDGLWGSWAWGLYVDGELDQVFATEHEAWDRAEQLEGYRAEEQSDPEAFSSDYKALQLEDDLARVETWAQTQDRERNQ